MCRLCAVDSIYMHHIRINDNHNTNNTKCCGGWRCIEGSAKATPEHRGGDPLQKEPANNRRRVYIYTCAQFLFPISFLCFFPFISHVRIVLALVVAGRWKMNGVGRCGTEGAGQGARSMGSGTLWDYYAGAQARTHTRPGRMKTR